MVVLQSHNVIEFNFNANFERAEILGMSNATLSYLSRIKSSYAIDPESHWFAKFWNPKSKVKFSSKFNHWFKLDCVLSYVGFDPNFPAD
jgi:hypothetical protein